MRDIALARPDSLATCLLAALAVAACAGADVTSRQTRLADQKIATPALVYVYDFASPFADAPEGSAIAAMAARKPAVVNKADAGLQRRLGAVIAKHLVSELQERGIAAVRAGAASRPRTGDAVVRGDFFIADKGNPVQRVLIGFGAGAAEVSTLTEIYLVVADTLVPLRSAEVEAEGGMMPGMVLSLGAGSLINVAFSGASAAYSEAGPESVEGAARRTATQIAQFMLAGYVQRGWR